jgi:predicted Rossmann-fold nucleotide-binding protein
MDELFEAITNVQLKLIKHKIILFNHEGFYNSLLVMLEQMKQHNFVAQSTIDKIIVVNNMEQCIGSLKNVEIEND